MSCAASRCIVCACLCVVLVGCVGPGAAVEGGSTAHVARAKLLEETFQEENEILKQTKLQRWDQQVADFRPAEYRVLTYQRRSAQQSSTDKRASSATRSLRDPSPHRDVPPAGEPGNSYNERDFFGNSQLLVQERRGPRDTPPLCHGRRRKRAFDLDTETRAAWTDPEGALTRAAEWFLRKLWMPIQELAGNGTLSSKCVSGLLSVYSGVKHGHLWALKFLDATGKFPSGVLTALSPSSDPGSYDECLSIGDRESAGMAGRYCTVLWVASAASLVSKLSGSDVSWNDTFQNSVKRIRQGVCVPSHCSGSELEALIEKVFNGSSTTATVSACRSRNDLTLTHTQLAIVCIFIVWITLVAFSTLLHFYWDRKETSSKETADSCLRRLTVALSAVTSIKRLLLVSQEKHMAAVQPLKAISLLWIILGMTYRSRLLEHSEHELDNEWGSGILYTLAASSDLAYTTVLLISGYCAANTVLELHRLKVSYVRRLIAVICLKNRLTVSAVLTLGAFLLYPLFVDGPGADRVLPRLSAVCQRRWGFVLVHLNNLRGHENVCYHPLWYISCEMQIFLALSGIVVLIRRFKRTTSAFLAFIALVAVAAVSAIVGVKGYQPPIIFNSRESVRTLSDIVYLPFLHAPAFIIGVLFNHWITRVRRVSITKCTRAILWLLSATALVWGAIYPCLWKSWVPSPTAAASVIFLVGLRLAWCAAVAFVLWVATSWKAGLVHDVLGCRTVAALGRLSLGAYLCSWMIAMHGVLSARHTLEAGQAFVVRDFVANTMLSYVAALLFYVACDGPAQSLCSLLRTLVIGREAARRRRSFDECDRKVRFLSELLGLEAPRSAKELPHQQYTSRTLQRISSLKDMVLHL